MKSKGLSINHYKVLSLPSNPATNSVYYVLDKVSGKIKTYITDKSGIPLALIDLTGVGQVVSVTGTAITGTVANPTINIATFVSEQLNNQIYLSLEDGKLQVNPVISPNSSIEVNATSTELQIQLSATITATINSALQAGDNISLLTNDAQYITIGEVQPTNLSYTASPTDGTVISSTGADATLPLATTVNAGLLAPSDKIKLNNTSNNNSGDQTSIVGITGTKSQFNTSVTDGDFLYSGDITQYTDELAQDAIGTILVDTSTIDLIYDDITPTISAIVKVNSITSNELSNFINNSEFVNDSNYENTTQLNARDVNNRARVNHTGTQLSSTISDFTTASRTASVSDTITDSVTNIAPSQNVVFDALALKAPLASPALTGTPTSTTATAGDNSTRIATTAFVTSNSIKGSGTLNVLQKATGTNTIGNSQIFDNGTNVGIGTTTPSTKLEVVDANKLGSLGNLNVRTSTAMGANIGGSLSLGGFYNDIDIVPFANIAGRKLNSTANSLSGYLQLSVLNSSGLITERMRIDSSGNIGIGMTAPTEKLEVSGNIKSTSFIKSGGTSSQFLKADGSVDSTGYTSQASTIVSNRNLSYGTTYNDNYRERVLNDLGTVHPSETPYVLGDLYGQSLLQQASLIITPSGTNTSKLYAVKPQNSTGDLDVVRATTATRVNADGLIEIVGLNVPRIDYTNGSCPSILIEPQSTNFSINSDGNLSTYPIKGGGVFDATSPINAFNNSIQFIQDGVSKYCYLRFTSTPEITYTFSCFIEMDDGGVPMPIGDDILTDLNIILGGIRATSHKIQRLGSTNIYRISGTKEIVNGGVTFGIVKYDYNSNRGFKVTGYQLEEGFTATSYIPTDASAVTRNKDVIDNSSTTTLIGQTEGTIFIEFDKSRQSDSIKSLLTLRSNLSTNYIQFLTPNNNQRLSLILVVNGVAFSMPGGSRELLEGKNKVVFIYSTSGSKFFLNGVLEATYANDAVPAMNFLEFGRNSGGQWNAGIYQYVLWKTQLTDAESIALTTL